MSFLTMALLEKFAGQITGSPPGTEMLEAARAAKAVGSRVEFIDLPITSTGAAPTSTQVHKPMPIHRRAQDGAGVAGSSSPRALTRLQIAIARIPNSSQAKGRAMSRPVLGSDQR